MLSTVVVVCDQQPFGLTRRRIMVDIRSDQERTSVVTLHRLIRNTMCREAQSIQLAFIIHNRAIGFRRAPSTILTFRQDAMVAIVAITRTVVDTVIVACRFGLDSKSLMLIST